MPRRRRVPRQPRAKVPKQAKIPRPKMADLRTLYKGLISVSSGNRISTLSYILQWYDNALPYLIQKKMLGVDSRARLEKAVKARKKGIDTTFPHEKEVCFRVAIGLYEKAYAALKPFSIEEAYKRFDLMKQKLLDRQAKMEQKYGQVVSMLQKAVGGMFKFEVADAQKDVQWNPELTTLTYNQEAAKALTAQYREQGLLPVFIEQMDYLVRHAVLEPDGNGGWVYDPAKHVEVMGKLLKAFVEFSKSSEAPKRLVRDLAPRSQVLPSQRPVGAPRGPRPGIRGPKVAGLYTQGSAAAIVYERLSDGKVWNMTDLLAGVNFSHPEWLPKRMYRLGVKTGCWEVKLTKTTAQLILPQPQQQAQAAQP